MKRYIGKVWKGPRPGSFYLGGVEVSYPPSTWVH